jgi:aspartyl-tRNA synthetase
VLTLSKIQRIDKALPKSFTRMITDLDEPAVDAIKVRLDGEMRDNWAFAQSFMDSLPTALTKNPDGAPAVLMFDSGKPMCGLSALGYEGFAALTSGDAGYEEFADLDNGDILIVQARENKPFTGGSTALGNLRVALYQEAVAKGLLPQDHSFKFLWVHGFPLFTPDNDTEPGQGGKAGFSSTHHPFTAPLTDQDFDLLAVDPLKAKADHYDLVVNGVELGGGSRRIHVAKVQEYVMRHILQMTDEGMSQFSHLLDALRAGCPPHAGFALGFDRLVALLSGTNSVRDVIAFPKSMKGEDLMVRSPGRVTSDQLHTYHLAIRKK